MVKRFLVQKLEDFAQEKHSILEELKGMFAFAEQKLRGLDLWNCYDMEADLSNQEWEAVLKKVLSEVNTDRVRDRLPEPSANTTYFAYQFLPGQFDQRADSAQQCILAVTGKKAQVQFKKIIGFEGNFSPDELNQMKAYLINDLDSHEVGLAVPQDLAIEIKPVENIGLYQGFTSYSPEEMQAFYQDHNLAMTYDDLVFCQQYFQTEHRDPTVTELKVIDTYWSDHCRHTTFATILEEIEWEEDAYLKAKQKAYQLYQANKAKYAGDKPQTLMDMATLGMKEMKARGLLDNLDQSAEINACSIRIPLKYRDLVGNQTQENYLLQFKNETHNHPTEIEPFGGAATCLGGAIRDPLSGRAYVFGGMRISGAGNPQEGIEATMAGKLPQRKISQGAADGYSSYGNQIGLATGEVREYYHPGFKAKRMELGAVIAAVPEKNVRREEPLAQDIVVVLGGATGRDGVGGATGSSKAHSAQSLDTAGAEVQKGNPPEERKLQRLFRNPEFSLCIKRCNDFGAGGVAVAIGELAPGLDIDLDSLPKKYEGLDGTELAVSESQERMAIVIEAKDLDKVIDLAAGENIRAVKTALINDQARLRMYWQGQKILDLDRKFLDTNGVLGRTKVLIPAIKDEQKPWQNRTQGRLNHYRGDDFSRQFLAAVSDLNTGSQMSLAEKFDSTVGRGTVLFPYGGKSQTSKVDGMVFKIPVEAGQTDQVAFMTHGYCPNLANWSPFHGGLLSGIMAVTKAVCLGAEYRDLRLSCQEYFERLGQDPKRWGKPVIALLASYYFQSQMGLASIGGKDSMSGSFEGLDVPPSLITFAVASGQARQVISPEFKQATSVVAYYPLAMNDSLVPDFEALKDIYHKIRVWNQKKYILAAKMVESSIASALAGMAFGNDLGLDLVDQIPDIFVADYASIVLEIPRKIWEREAEDFSRAGLQMLGQVSDQAQIKWKGERIGLDQLKQAWTRPLANIFKDHDLGQVMEPVQAEPVSSRPWKKKFPNINKGLKPLVCIPVFPGTNCEYDIAKAFAQEGARVESLVICNRTRQELSQSIARLRGKIEAAQILALAGGFSAGDEPDGAGKFIAAILSQPVLKEAINHHVKLKKGLVLGICNGFQALVKTGLLPYGEITDLGPDSPTLTYNHIGRHVSRVVNTEICSINSPWASRLHLGDMHAIAISHGEGRFYAKPEWIQRLIQNQQIFSRYVAPDKTAYQEGIFNPNGSSYAIEGIISQDGLILGKMGHTERYEPGLLQNIFGNKQEDIFGSGLDYFK